MPANQVPAERERIVPIALEAAWKSEDRPTPSRRAQFDGRQRCGPPVLGQRECALCREQLAGERQTNRAEEKRDNNHLSNSADPKKLFQACNLLVSAASDWVRQVVREGKVRPTDSTKVCDRVMNQRLFLSSVAS